MLRPAALLAYTVLAVALFANVWIDPAASWIGDSKDPKLFIWYLGWLPNQLAQLHNPFLTDYIAYPQGANLMWNTSIIFPALVLWPVTAAFGPVVAYNVMVTAAVALSAWFAYLVAARYLDHPLLAGVVGLLYGFSPGMLAQATRHPHVMIALLPPLLWLLGDEILVRQRYRPVVIGGLAGLVCAFQLLTGEEVLAVTVLIAFLGIALLVALHPRSLRDNLPYVGRAAGAAALTLLLVAGYPLAVQFFGPQQVAGSLQVTDFYVNDLVGFVSPDPALLRFGGSAATIGHLTGNVSENDAYLGIPLLALFLIGLAVNWRRPLVRWAGLLTLVVALLSLGPRLHIYGTPYLVLPWAVVARLPLMGSALPSRLMLTAFLGIGLVAVALVDRASQGAAWVRWGTLAMLAVAVLSLVPVWPFLSTPATAPRFFQPGGAVASVPLGSVVLVTPFSSSRSTDAMYWQALSNYRFRMPEGDAFTPGPYLGPHPTYLQTILDQLDSGQDLQLSADSRDRALQSLAAMHVGTVVAGPSPGQDRVVQFLTALLGGPPVEVDGVYVWWQVDQVTSADRVPRISRPATANSAAAVIA
jgi:hypothetical protein